jgi:predicted nucleotidyltransferase
MEFARRYRALAETAHPGEVLDVRLFGSRARGDHREDSDLDLFVSVKSDDLALRNALVDLAWDVSYAMDLPYPVVAHVMPIARYERLLALERRLATDIRDEGVAI